MRSAKIKPLIASMAIAWSLALTHTHAQTTNTTDFVTTWTTTIANETIVFPGSPATDDDGNVTGTYTVRASNTITAFTLNFSNSAPKLITVQQWGTAQWTTMENAFQGAQNMTATATDKPTLSQDMNL